MEQVQATADLTQIGTVEILMPRTYTLDPKADLSVYGYATEVLVQPGVYPLYEYKGMTRLWIMEGEITVNSLRLGDGIGVIVQGDRPTGIGVRFPSRSYGADEWKELISMPMCQPGPQRRLVIEIDRVVVEDG